MKTPLTNVQQVGQYDDTIYWTTVKETTVKFPRSKPAMVSLTVVGLVSPILLSSSVGATVTKMVGNGVSVSVSWTEYDPDDLLGLPGNVHVGVPRRRTRSVRDVLLRERDGLRL